MRLSLELPLLAARAFAAMPARAQSNVSPAGAGINFPANPVFSGNNNAPAPGGGSQTAAPAPLLSCAGVHVNNTNEFVVVTNSVGDGAQCYFRLEL